jgi:hypothetical protein
MCVFTALLGGYERLNEQPMALQSKIPFVCLTDDPDLRSDTWQMRVVSPAFGMDFTRSQRDFKLRPHIHLPEFDLSLYIDNAVLLTRPPEDIVEQYPPTSGFRLARHSIHDCVLEEFLQVIKRGLDEQSRVFEQLNHYSLLFPEVLDERLYWGGILLRDHREPKVRAMLDIWYAHVLRYSRRDQLSVNMAFRQSGLKPDVMEIDNLSSPFHAWPITVGRVAVKRPLSPTISLGPPVARLREMEQELAEIRRLQEQALASAAWRIGSRLSGAAQRHPRLRGLALRAGRLLGRGR